MQSSNNYANVPDEMRLYKSWCVWRYEDLEGAKPTKVPYSALNGRLASVTDPSTWASFDQAVSVAVNHPDWYAGIGFVLSEQDPFCFIDLDNPYELRTDGAYKYDNPEQILDRQLKVYTEFPSYAELSPSGKGLHIIVRGSVPSGRRRSAIEVYSSERYMTVTGNVYRQSPIVDCNGTLQALYEQMGGVNAANLYAGDAVEKEPDENIIGKALNAANGDKFKKLYGGEWQDLYPSQSEADFALVDILAFYTQNKAQIARLFRNSALGERPKARRDDYVNYMLNKCFDRMLPPVDIDGLRNAISDAVAAKKASPATLPVVTATGPASPANPYTAPPGLVGALARFIYDAAPRPVPEIALAGAIGLMAGIVGRAYNVSGTGLNQYILLLAPTGTGKEAIASGIDKLIGSVVRIVPTAQEFIGPAEISSPQALTKYLGSTSRSFVSIFGEVGLWLKMLCSPHAPTNLIGLRKMILDLYNKTGEGKFLRPTIYSEKEKNTALIMSPAFSLLGESTPERFYETLDESMISEGLLPRMTVIPYDGERPPLNPAHQTVQPSFELSEKLASLCAHAQMLNSQDKVINVKLDANATRIFRDFDKHCDDNINSADKEVRRHLWNRAHMKTLKLAATVAVGLNPYEPIIDDIAANWALGLVIADVRNLLSRFDAGEIGIDNDETRQLRWAIDAAKEYVTRPWSEISQYKAGTPQLHGERLIPYSYMHRRLASQGVFKRDKLGSTTAIKRAIKTLVERGDLAEVSRQKLTTEYKTHAACYMIASPRTFGLA